MGFTFYSLQLIQHLSTNKWINPNGVEKKLNRAFERVLFFKHNINNA